MLYAKSALVLAFTISFGTPDQSAAHFVETLYAPYRNAKGTSTDYSSLQSRNEEQDIYSTGVLRLLDADRAHTPEGYEGALDSDPLCQCQDSEGLRLERVKQVSITDNRAEVSVTLRFVGSHPKIKNLHILLVREVNGWRIDDIQPSRGQNLRQALQPAKSK